MRFLLFSVKCFVSQCNNCTLAVYFTFKKGLAKKEGEIRLQRVMEAADIRCLPLGRVGGVAELEPLTWTWMHSLLTLDRGDGIPPEGWSTWAGPA